MQEYYDRLAPEYDEWYLGLGRFDSRPRAAWNEELRALTDALGALPPASTLDVACGTGFLTRHLAGDVVGLDTSGSMIEIARRQAPNATYIQGDALALPFEDDSFERVFTGHFYGHLDDSGRVAFLAEARRVAPELLVVDAALRPDRQEEEWQERLVRDGSCWTIYKRYFTPGGLAAELAGEVLFQGRWFVVVRSLRPTAPR